jgi:excinuclease ABC subunit A
VLTAITGVSGSGKTTLVKKILFPSIKRRLDGHSELPGKHKSVEGALDRIKAIELVDQNPIGKSSRSNPVTYVKAFDEIRSLFSELPVSRARAYKPAHFSFNVDGGRCEMCEGAGEITIEMQFMADLHLVCESCKGKRYKQDLLDVTYFEKNISDILEMTVDDAISFFSVHKKDHSPESRIVHKLQPLADVGLGYIQLGQSSSTLSGGEAQRIKLATFIGKGHEHQNTLFIFDEPTTGLHFHDIRKLLQAFDSLISNGNGIIVIEHNPDVIKCADWIIDLGPEGGKDGGRIVFEGTPEDLVKSEGSHTAKFIAEKLS